jgi:hypothetical protein
MADLSKFSTDDLKALAAGDMSKMSTGGLKMLADENKGSRQRAQEHAPGVRDMAEFVSGNVGKGMAGLAGLPVDTALNVWDMGKAGLGTAQGALTGKAPSAAFDPTDRGGVVGSSENLIRAAQRAGLISPAAEPTSGAGRVAAGGIQAGTAAMLGGGRLPSTGAAVRQGAAGALSGGLAAGAGEAGLDPATQQLVGMSPGLAGQAAPVGVEATRKALVRPGAPERLRSQQEAGMGGRPSAAAAAGGPGLLADLTATGQRLPGGTPFSRAADERAAGAQRRTEEIARQLAPNGEVGKLAAGARIKAGAEQAVESFRTVQGQLYERVDQLVSPQQDIPLTNFRAKLREFANPVRGAEATTASQVPAPVAAYLRGLETDLAAVNAKTAPPVSVGPEPPLPGPRATPAIRRAMTREHDAWVAKRDAAQAAADAAVREPGQRANDVTRQRDGHIERIERTIDVRNPAAEGRDAKNSLPYEAVAGIRSQLGRMTEDGLLLSDAPKSMYKALYRALNDDIRAALPPDARAAWERASRYTRAGHDRIESVYQPLMDKNTPELALRAALGKGAGESSAFRRIMGSLTPAQRDAVGAHVIENLGKAAPGRQDAEGQVFSLETFLTNYNRMPEASRRALYPSPATRESIDAIARAASDIRMAMRDTANASGSGRAVSHTGFYGAGLAGVLVPLLTGNPGVAAGTAGALAGEFATVNLLSRAMTSPDFVKWLAEGTQRPQQDQMRYAARLATIARNTRDPETKQALNGVYANLAQQLGLPPPGEK